MTVRIERSLQEHLHDDDGRQDEGHGEEMSVTRESSASKNPRRIGQGPDGRADGTTTRVVKMPHAHRGPGAVDVRAKSRSPSNPKARRGPW